MQVRNAGCSESESAMLTHETHLPGKIFLEVSPVLPQGTFSCVMTNKKMTQTDGDYNSIFIQ